VTYLKVAEQTEGSPEIYSLVSRTAKKQNLREKGKTVRFGKTKNRFKTNLFGQKGLLELGREIPLKFSSPLGRVGH